MNGDIDPLTRLAIKHGTDKWGPHFYTPVYHELFAHLRDLPVRLLEIGVGGYGWTTIGGASLAMWAEYFPRGHIVSFDTEQKKLNLAPTVTVLRGSQDDTLFLEDLVAKYGPFDIIIDDGSHRPHQVVATFRVLFPGMAPAGLYVIEDVQTCFWPEFGGTPTGGETMMLATSLLRDINHAELRVFDAHIDTTPIAERIRSIRARHNLIIVENGDNTEPSNFAYDPSSKHAVHALATIEQELEHSPTPEGFANLIRLLMCSGAFSRAQTILRDALGKWPMSSTLLALATQLEPTIESKLAMLDRLAKLEPAGAANVQAARLRITAMRT